jgi:Vacuolar sorting 38 and autophagy-related subunit 14
LPALAKEDPTAYSYFIEGVTLLAWDIAWLCRTQGLDAVNTWEDVCPLGKNLWQLLVAPVPKVSRPPLTSTPSDAIVTSGKQAITEKEWDNETMFGYFSHGTAHSFLGSADGNDFMKSWNLQGHMKIVDKVKSLLMSEMAGAEWDLLNDKDWEDEEITAKREDEAVILGGGRETPNKEVMHPEDWDDGTPSPPKDRDNSKGTSGWTKLKSRETPKE